ncbi:MULTISPECIES: hypothetical protein [unclassified Novosphingobium]|uniref:hypothetical protein n=1 Tax=unclassified Novosphingobium TaxID=2644732 RepID=UPI000D4CB9A1|nr:MULTISPECIES: hypothetical protein [unclassified Novosphingobium]PTR12016.1 hypothetical protein C8K11_104381 [Novosphingobium sp. GV055]PUB05056.1 hypothetical protein C8K12_104381 [Novosphingobium sp. GV061]PUB21375.1 hypothetical protein C8K14_104381 [Novosphingobium sp. GV079]PUB43101.1 hypothetical protein C8K10_104381 [Novosphingobium sp. GV027]
MSEGMRDGVTDAGDESLIILESLLCLMREKNLLSRSDIELLCEKVERRATGTSRNPLPCNNGSATEAVSYLRRLSAYLGQRYGGKHMRRGAAN